MKKSVLFFFALPLTVLSFSAAAHGHGGHHGDRRARYDNACEQVCGAGFFYDRRGNLFNGREIVCKKYPKPCGYDCTRGWNIEQAPSPDRPYTCQTAVQESPF